MVRTTGAAVADDVEIVIAEVEEGHLRKKGGL
jgi:hypothetical protein